MHLLTSVLDGFNAVAESVVDPILAVLDQQLGQFATQNFQLSDRPFTVERVNSNKRLSAVDLVNKGNALLMGGVGPNPIL